METEKSARRLTPDPTPGAASGGAVSVRERIAASLLFAAIAIAFTWPAAREFGRAIPSGCDAEALPLLQLFAMEWNREFLTGAAASYFDAPIFAPVGGAFAWSEPQQLTGAVFTLLAPWFGSAGAYTLVVWLALASSGAAGYWFARLLGCGRAGGIWAGAWMTAGACSLEQLGPLHLVFLGPPLLLFGSALQVVTGPTPATRRRAVVTAGLATLATWLTCLQHGMFCAVLLPLFLLPALASAHRLRHLPWKRAVLAAAIVLGTLGPLLWSQRQQLDALGFERRPVDVVGVMSWADYVLPARGHWLVDGLLGRDPDRARFSWDLGVVSLVLICLALAVRTRPLAGKVREHRAAVAGLVLVVAVAVLLGRGPLLRIEFGETSWQPYRWLYQHVPLFSSIRTPSRFAFYASAAIAVFGGLALDALRTGRGKTAVTTIAFALLAGEMWLSDVQVADASSDLERHRSATAALSEAAPGSVLELPLPTGRSESSAPQVHAMRRTLRHGHACANGYSGYATEPSMQLKTALDTDATGRGARFVRALGVRYLWLHRHDGEDPARWREVWPDAQGLHADERDVILDLAPGSSAAPQPVPFDESLLPDGLSLSQEPRPRTVLRVPLRAPTAAASLLLPDSTRTLELRWEDEARTLPLVGAVLIDRAARAAHVIVLSDGRAARFLRADQAEPLLRSRRGGSPGRPRRGGQSPR